MAERQLGTLGRLVIARRNLSHVRQIPEKLIDVTVQPLMLPAAVRLRLRRRHPCPGGNYRQYPFGGIFVQTRSFGIIRPSTSIATDLREGIVDRFRSLPRHARRSWWGT